MKALGRNNDEIALKAATQTLVEAVPTIVASGGHTEKLFEGTLRAALAAIGGEQDDHAVANTVSAGLKAGLTDGQVEILAQQAAAARAHRDRLAAEAAAAEQEIAPLLAQLGDQPALAELGARADRELSTTSRSVFYRQLAASAGQPSEMLKAIAAAQLSFLGRGAPPDGAADQITQQLIQLGAAGLAAESIEALGAKHLLRVEPQDATATLGLLAQIIAVVGVPDDPVTLANSLIGVAARYAEGNPALLESLTAALAAGAGDPEVRAHAERNAARYSAEIPKVEGGPIVELLRHGFAEDMAAVAKAGLDVAMLDAAWPRLPGDAIARLIAIGTKHGAELDTWLTDLDKFFASGRGNKDHERNLRTLLVTTEQNGGDAVDLVRAILGAKLRMADVCKLANYVNIETDFAPSAEYVLAAVQKLDAQENLVAEIEHRMHGAVMEKLNLGQLLQGAGEVHITEKGLADVQGPLAPLFSAAAGNANVDQEILKGLLEAALADRVDQYRFETPHAETHLACLTGEAAAQWKTAQRMTHIRFEGDGEQVFLQRLQRTALIGNAILERLNESWGPLDEIQTKRDALVVRIRQIDKSKDREEWLGLVREVEDLPKQIEAIEWATTLAELTPENVTPERFARLADRIPSFRKVFGPPLDDAMEELVWTIRLAGISYSRVVTDDGPDLPTMYAMTVDRAKTGGGCLNWPGGHGEGMAYWTDPNKRMIVTRNAAGQERRAMMRLVERQDEGHEGEPMLIIDKAYPPFEANHDEKRRLIEHLLRRASSMGIACGFATEYYWDASKTNRFSGHQQFADMNEILLDLCKRYGTEVDKKEMKLLTRMGNTGEEYMDSDPPQGQRGVATVRRWIHNFQQDSKVFENEFIVLVPK